MRGVHQTSEHEVIRLLAPWSNGDKSAFDKLMPLIHDELRRLAHRYMSRERPGHTLQTTALPGLQAIRLDYGFRRLSGLAQRRTPNPVCEPGEDFFDRYPIEK